MIFDFNVAPQNLPQHTPVCWTVVRWKVLAVGEIKKNYLKFQEENTIELLTFVCSYFYTIQTTLSEDITSLLPELRNLQALQVIVEHSEILQEHYE